MLGGSATPLWLLFDKRCGEGEMGEHVITKETI